MWRRAPYIIEHCIGNKSVVTCAMRQTILVYFASCRNCVRGITRVLSVLCFAAASEHSAVMAASTLAFSEEISAAIEWPGARVPKWSHGSLIAVQNSETPSPTIWLIGRNGRRSFSFTLPGAQQGLLYDWDLGSDGTIGLSGGAADQ